MTLPEILTKAASFVAIIAFGYVLRQSGFFKEKDFYFLTKIVLKITLPAAIVYNFSSMEIDVSMLAICLFGLGGGLLYIAVAWLVNARKPAKRKAFDVVNLPGYNIGNFTMPFIQGFLGPTGFAATSLFDTGNAFVCLGGSYSLAGFLLGEGEKRSVKDLIKPLIRSVPFAAYIIMTILTLAHIRLPQIAVSFAETIAGANAFMALLMVGVGFQLKVNRENLAAIFRILGFRYAMAIIFSVLWYRFAPFSLEVRQALAILAFAPIATAAPAFTGNLNLDTGLSSVINSISVILSVVLITITLALIL